MVVIIVGLFIVICVFVFWVFLDNYLVKLIRFVVVEGWFGIGKNMSLFMEMLGFISVSFWNIVMINLLNIGVLL